MDLKEFFFFKSERKGGKKIMNMAYSEKEEDKMIAWKQKTEELERRMADWLILTAYQNV